MSNTVQNGNAHYGWPQFWRDAIQFLTMAFALYASHMGNKNNDKIAHVENKQEVAAQKAEVVRERIDNKSEEESRALGVQLYSTWKYLEDVAAISMQPRDFGKAAEAKKVYEDHVKKYGTPAAPKFPHGTAPD